MSDTNTENPVIDETQLGYKLVEEKFVEGDWAGFKFYVPEFSAVDTLVEKYGADNLIELVNQSISNRIRQAVKNKLVKNASPETLKTEQSKILAETQGVLFSKANAIEWKMSFRDTEGTGITSIQRQLNAAMKTGNIQLISDLMAKSQEVMTAELNKLKANNVVK